MMLVELFAPKGALSPEQRRQVAERLATEVMNDESAPSAVVEASLAMSHVVVHEPDTWLVGTRPVETEEPPYLVRVSVPNAWRKEISEHLIARVTRVLADVDGDPHRLYREPHAWVHVVGVPEGSMGSFGHVLKSTDLVKMITKSFRESGAPAPSPTTDPVFADEWGGR